MSKLPITRLFIANRGEIAVRIIHACRKLGIETVIGVSEADRESLGAKLADRAVCIGPPPAAQSYLNMQIVVTAAKGTGCQALHPGYGFLAERSGFARMCVEHGLIFVGPTADAIDAVGDKLRARKIAESLGIPTVSGTDRIASANELLQFGQRNGYPFIVKASAGGGGRGMRIVRTPKEAGTAFSSASAEARAAFGDPTLYIERYIERARHVEVQVIGDVNGNVIHLGERDCSTQRRHQKLIEEAPSPIIDEGQRTRMAEAAIRLARHVHYVNAGTVEFILDLDSGDFYFLEMNTRIQVEHPVTEFVTEIDIVVEQLNVASGSSLSFRQKDVRLRGHSIECRINAEVPGRGFQPSPGQIRTWRPPAGPGIRVDTHCYSGYSVPPFYDSMIGKLIVHGNNRAEAVASMFDALGRFVIEGIGTTISFHETVLAHTDFVNNRVTTRWVEEKLMNELEPTG